MSRIVHRSFVLSVLVCLGALCCAAEAAVYPHVVLSDDPFAYYRFEETSGTIAADSSTTGANHEAAYVGTFGLGATSASDLLGTAAQFSGGNATRVRIPRHADFDLGTGNYSIELWYQTTSGGRGDLLTNKAGGPDLGIHSASQGADTVSLYHNGFVASPNAAPRNQWYHLVATRSGTDSVSFYLNGELVNTGSNTGNWNASQDILIGSNHDGNADNAQNFFNGRIDEVAFYNAALSADRVKAHYLAAFPEFGNVIPLGNLFDDVPGTILRAAISTDTFKATAQDTDLGVERVVRAGGTPGTVQTIAGSVSFDLAAVGWQDSVSRNVVNDAWGETGGDGGIQTLGVSIPGNAPEIEEGIGMHANQMVTFNLEELMADESIVPGSRFQFVSERAGVNDDVFPNGTTIHAVVLLSNDDGVLAGYVNGEEIPLVFNGAAWAFDGAIPAALAGNTGEFASFDVYVPTDAKFLTLAITGAGTGINSAHGVFSGARLMVVPEPSAGLLFALGMGAVALFAWRRRRA